MNTQGDTTDPQLQQFIEIESQKQRFQQLVHQMTDVCWVSKELIIVAIKFKNLSQAVYQTCRLFFLVRNVITDKHTKSAAVVGCLRDALE